MEKGKLVSLLLRLGLAAVFLYAAIDAFIDPSLWIGYLPVFLTNVIRGDILLSVFSAYEILLALWLLSGRLTFYSATLTALTLFGIIVFNTGQFEVLFRDVAILFSASALAVLAYEVK